MSEPEIKFSKGWYDYLEQYRESARRTDGENIQFVFHIVPGKKTTEIVREIDEWIRKSQGEEGQHFSRLPRLHRVLFMGLMNEIPISLKEPQRGMASFCKTRKDM